MEPLRPPADSVPGDKIIIEGYEDGTADDVLNPKKKVWEKLQVFTSLTFQKVKRLAFFVIQLSGIVRLILW